MSTVLFNRPVKQNFIAEPIKDDHYVQGDGNLGLEVLMPTGHGWGDYLPLGETQFKNGVDPASCAAGGTLNCIEAIGRKKYGLSFQNDLSERYLAIMSGMKGNGGRPHDVAERIRTVVGAIPEVFLPFNNTITTLKKYFSPSPMSYNLFKVGIHWNKKYLFQHEWLFRPNENIPVFEKRRRFKEALKSSPVGVSGYAWSLHSDGKYYKDGADIHWFIGFEYFEDDYILAFDTYPDGSGSYIKKLDWNYDFGYAKRYALNYTDEYKAKIQKFGGAEKVPEEPIEECKVDYIKYLFSWFISSLKPQ